MKRCANAPCQTKNEIWRKVCKECGYKKFMNVTKKLPYESRYCFKHMMEEMFNMQYLNPESKLRKIVQQVAPGKVTKQKCSGLPLGECNKWGKFTVEVEVPGYRSR